MAADPSAGLGGREREIVEILYRLRSATPPEVREEIADELSDSTVRSMLRHLMAKGLVRRRREDGRWVYYARRSAAQVRDGAVAHVLDTFFRGSPAALVSSLVQSSKHLDERELDRLAQLIEDARRRKD